MRAKLELLRVAVLVLSVFEAPVWLFRNRRLFRNRVIFLFDHRAFGHTVSGLDFAARRFHPNRVSVVYMPNNHTNAALLDLFSTRLDIFVFESRIGPKSASIDKGRTRVVRFYLRLAARVLKRELVELLDVYAWEPLAPGPLYGADEDGKARIVTTNYTGYLRLLRERPELAPRLPDTSRERVREAIELAHPGFFERPTATVLFREKGRGWALDSSSRTVGDQRHYRRAVALLGERGYNVVGTGETVHARFADLDAYVDLTDVVLDEQLLNVFLLSECALFVGQQSGPFVLPDARGIPCVLCDAFPYRLGTFQPRDLVLFKPLLDADGRRLTFTEIYRDRPELAYGYGLDAAGVTIGANDDEEIAAAVEELLGLIDGTFRPTADDERLIEEFHALVPPEMALHWHGNRPPLSALRAYLR
jgi:putative glycosyltransferase (TIGR04372 family)